MSVAAPRNTFRRRPTSSSSPGFSPPCARRVSTLTLARPKSGSSPRTRIVTGADGGTRTTFSAGSSIDTSGAMSGSTSIRYSIFSVVTGSRLAAGADFGWNISR